MQCLSFDLESQAWITSLCGPVQGVPVEDKYDQQLSRLAGSV